MTPLADLEALANPEKAAEMLAYHKAPRRYLGVTVPQIDDLTDGWRAALSLDDRIALAASLWATDIHEARIAAAKLLTQARLRPDAAAWALIQSWVPDFDAWAIADHASIAGQKRLTADPSRLDTLDAWITSPHMWTRRAALVMTLPWTKQNHPKPEEEAARDRILGWCATLADDRDWFIQKAVAWWVRDLSKHDAARARAFLDTHGARLKPFAQKEAARHLSP
ncbi:MAG: DNA alkylation repair protein [Tabrizicola sp.]|uniref:DNA alkylation repair protein n=1 Tax=Tabrizicola sp. TaxID=2005166 RepID=UPI0027354CDA|nr:DNA alkylation repair protein [Tabrizicola sp.]MDP3262814.1 DNA alkylation repair protein [Tabrizicola sp.]MDP3649011.1 DNA alkylation repair protein [Paracoccaceae bacterium]MDZ4068715.1 DNA alkylation repair protein [Tabrizicola sp.]